MGLRHLPRPLKLRRTVVDRLTQASIGFPLGFSLVILDGWRTRAFQRELLEYYTGRYGPVTGYVSDPDSVELVAPHTTGGAVDLTLAYKEFPLALGTDFDDFSPFSHLLAYEGAPVASALGHDAEVVKALRRMLAKALTDVEFAPFPREWWHWSFGDQRWAAQYGRPRSLYSPV